MFAFFDRLSVSKRILAGFGVSVVMLAGIVAANVANTNQLGDVFKGYRTTSQQSVEISEFTQQVYDARLAVFEYTTRPSEVAAEAVRVSLQGVSDHLWKSVDLFGGDKKATGAIAEELENYELAFATVTDIETVTSSLIDSTLAIEPEFEKSLNGFLFTARISADQKSIDHGAAALLSFERGLSEFHGYLASEDPKKLAAAGPLFAEVRSELGSIISHLKIKGKDTSGVEKTLSVVDILRERLPKIGEKIEARAAAREELSAVGPRLLGHFVDLGKKITNRQGEIGAAAERNISSSLVMSLAIGGAGVVLAVVAALLIGKVISGAINRQSNAMSRLASGDLTAPIEGAKHDHELGRMAKALQVFKENARRVADMKEERERQEAAAAAARAEMMEELRRSFGAVVDAAVAGDFSKRVDAQFADAELNELASGVNRLVETVNQGLEETGRVLSQIAHGDLSDRMHGQFEGAFAELKTNVNHTVKRLSEMVHEITSSVDMVERGSGEISSGAVDLSTRAEQQASALEETAATMEEMSASIKSNADSSINAQSLAADASERADNGGAIVRQAVDAMGEIEDSASKIADIISVIDGIAFQTNLLALNAAVEAARAGDAGKGFAVVASEVRALAQRSSDAAQDIRGLIETSAGQVSHGVRLVTQTGEALEGIVASIAQVEETISSIASASREQAAGVEEITSSIGHMDGMTQQNSALAEKSAANARSLAEGAQALQQLIAFFKVKQEQLEAEQAAA